jgi:catalase
MTFRIFPFAGLLLSLAQAELPVQSSRDLVRQIAELMAQGPSGKAHQRFVHAKGIVCRGTFQASSAAAAISRAAHFHGDGVPITVRSSDGAPDANVADSSPDAAPRGMAIRLGPGRGTDIMAISHNGFIAGSGEEFLTLQQAITATDSSKPHPWPIEAFLASHPKALKFVQDSKQVPVSFAAESFFSNNALIFVNDRQEKRAGRYQILPVNGSQYLDEATAKAMPPNFLREELTDRLAKAPIRFRLLLQLAHPGDETNDGSVVWPDTRKRLELGIVSITSLVPHSVAAERQLAFDPTRLVDGIELSDDPLPMLRSRVYVYSVAGRLGNR